MRYAVLILAVAVAGCTTTEYAVRERMTAWHGQPVREFAEHHSMMPDGVNTRPDGRRSYMFTKRLPMGQCGVTIIASAGSREWLIDGMSSTCPPSAI